MIAFSSCLDEYTGIYAKHKNTCIPFNLSHLIALVVFSPSSWPLILDKWLLSALLVVRVVPLCLENFGALCAKKWRVDRLWFLYFDLKFAFVSEKMESATGPSSAPQAVPAAPAQERPIMPHPDGDNGDENRPSSRAAANEPVVAYPFGRLTRVWNDLIFSDKGATAVSCLHVVSFAHLLSWFHSHKYLSEGWGWRAAPVRTWTNFDPVGVEDTYLGMIFDFRGKRLEKNTRVGGRGKILFSPI